MIPSRADRLADAMVADWAAGRRRPAEDYLPADLTAAEALEVIAEEIALRQGDPTLNAEELRQRFPQWAAPLERLFRFHNLITPLLTFAPGDVLGEFLLGDLIGRGANSQVFRATQPALADRGVVLKITPADGAEHLHLARLQHTHIVPLYWEFQESVRGVRVLCMPDFGGSTLASRTTPLRDDAVVALGIALGEALQYAHDRGLLHLDVKPSNVLIAADGTPMLLDFHLARAPLAAGATAPHWLGGTPGFMPPEQLRAMDAVRANAPIPQPVDARADVFALGRLLQHSRGGRFDSLALHAAVDRCIAERAADRYPTAAAFVDDLKRHRRNETLRGVRNRSLRERWAKWQRRRPFALMFLVLAGLLMFGGVAAVVTVARMRDDSLRWLATGENLEAAQQYAEAQDAYRQGLDSTFATSRQLRHEFATRLRRAESGAALAKLHDFVDAVRPWYHAPAAARLDSGLAHQRCQDLWNQRQRLIDAANTGPPAMKDSAIDDVRMLGVLTAHLAEPTESGHRTALQTLDEAELLAGGSAIIDGERLLHARALGRNDVTTAAAATLALRPRTTASDALTCGLAALATGNDRVALEDFQRAARLDPRSHWAQYFQGVTALRLNDASAALESFAASVALQPRSAWCVYNRGLAWHALGNKARADADFAQARVLDPKFPFFVPRR